MRLQKYGYAPVPCTPALWKHATGPTIFSLVVGDFGISYEILQDTTHLINSLKELYDITVDWTGKLYCGLTLEWDHYN